MSEVAPAAAARPRKTAAELVESMRGEIAKTLPRELSPDSFLRLALTELRLNPVLAQCSAESLLGALMTAARLGLEPGGPLGQFYLTPRRLRDEGMAVVPIVGFQGLRDLAFRSGLVTDIDAILVRDGDSYREGADEARGHWFDWTPLEGGSSDRVVTGALGLASLVNGGRVFRYLDLDEINARKARGSAGDKGPWRTDYQAMVRKTAVRALAPLLPKSAGMAAAVRVDEQVQHYDPKSPEWSEPAGELTEAEEVRP